MKEFFWWYQRCAVRISMKILSHLLRSYCLNLSLEFRFAYFQIVLSAQNIEEGIFLSQGDQIHQIAPVLM